MAPTIFSTFSVLKDHVKLKVSQDAVRIDNIGNYIILLRIVYYFVIVVIESVCSHQFLLWIYRVSTVPYIHNDYQLSLLRITK